MRLRRLAAACRQRAVDGLLFFLPALLLYALTAHWPDTPDGLFHLHRVRALAEAFHWGTLYPRWFPDFAFGYGYPVLNFYAPASYYPPALLVFLGVDILSATRVVLALAYALSGWITYRLLRQWTAPWAAEVGATLYLTFPYHLYDLFIRGALPEFIAFLWPPLILWATVHLGRPLAPEDTPIWRSWLVSWHRQPVAVALAALAWAGLILTHNLTALMAALALLIYVLVLILILLLRGAWRNGHHLATLLLPLLLAGGIGAFYVLPALVELPNVGLGAGPETRGYVHHFAHLNDLFTWTLLYPYPDAGRPTVPVPAYVLLVLLAGAFVLLARRSPQPRPLLSSLLAVLFTFYMTTWASASVWNGLAGLLAKLQFPWRWQALFSLALALTLALTLDAWRPSRPRRGWILAGALTLLLGGYTFLPLHPPSAPYTTDDLTSEQMWSFDREHGQVGASWTAEFLPRWVTEQRWAIGREPANPSSMPAGAAPRLIPWAWGYLRFLGQVENDTPRPVLLTFHAFYYPAWYLLLDGSPWPTRPETNLGLLTADIPPGLHTIELRWGETPAARLGRALSLLTLGVLLATLLFWGKGRRARVLAAACALVLLSWLAVRLLLPYGLLRPIHPIEARYPAVTLTGGDTVPTIAPNTLRVRLLWLSRERGTHLTAFVHLVDKEGRVVAQHDGPIGATVTPPQRWFPGLLIPDDHLIPLDKVPSGTYHVRVGVYRPGQADAPLHPDGASETEIELKVIRK